MLNRNIKFKIALAALVIIFSAGLVQVAVASDDIKNAGEKKLYSLNWSKVSKLISSIGYRDFIDDDLARSYWDAISRNADGTSIRIINVNTKTAMVFNCDGSFKKIDLPSFNSWLNNDNNILAWTEKGEVNRNAIKYFKGNPPAVMDPSGQYFIANINIGKGEIFSIAKPDIPLARVNIISASGLFLFLKENKLYVFGYDKKGFPLTLKGFIYERDGGKFRLAEEFEIPREKKAESPYVVEDMNPWSDEILLVDFHDFPSLSKRYVFNLKTKVLKYYGLATREKCLFLQCDILEKVEDKLKKN